MENIVKIQSDVYFAEINLSRGANCISLRNEKYEAKILREPDYSKELDNPYLYGMPILYPVNRILGGGFEFEGRKYGFPINEPNTNCHIHGLLHESEFKLLSRTENSVKCILESGDIYPEFPHCFRVTMSYELSKNGLCHKTDIENLSNMNMPNFLGFHTTFNIPFAKGTMVDDISIHMGVGDEIERNMDVYLPTGVILSADDVTNNLNSGFFRPFENVISRHYKVADDNSIAIEDNDKKIKVVYENDVKYQFRLIYNGNADEYICLEPMTCMANCQNSLFDIEYAGFEYIGPGKTKTYISKIYIEEIV